MYTYRCIYIQIYICMYEEEGSMVLFVRPKVASCACIYICMCIYMCTWIYVYVHIYQQVASYYIYATRFICIIHIYIYIYI